MSKSSYELFRGELMGANQNLALRALSLAYEAHKGVTRKDGVTPYIEHPCKVAAILFDLGIEDEIILSTAILHDVVEDTSKNCADIFTKLQDFHYSQKLDSQFTEENREASTTIAYLVAILTKTNKSTEEYYDLISAYCRTVLVKLADRVHNLSTLYNFSTEKKLAYLEETKKYIYPLIEKAQYSCSYYHSQLRILDLWIESLVENIYDDLTREEKKKNG